MKLLGNGHSSFTPDSSVQHVQQNADYHCEKGPKDVVITSVTREESDAVVEVDRVCCLKARDAT